MHTFKLAQMILSATESVGVKQLIVHHDLSIDHVHLLKKEALGCVHSDQKQAHLYATTALRLGKQLSSLAEAIGAWAMGSVSLIRGEYVSAVQHYYDGYDYLLHNGHAEHAYDLAIGYVMALAYTGQINEAIELAKLIVTENKNSVYDPHNNLGTALMCAGRYEEALEAYNKALAHAKSRANDEQMARVQQNRAYLLGCINLPEQAFVAFREAERLLLNSDRFQSDLSRLHTNWGELYTQLERYDEAEVQFAQSGSYLGSDLSLELTRLRFRQILNHLYQVDVPDDSLMDEMKMAYQLIKTCGYPKVMVETILTLLRCHRLRGEWEEATALYVELETMVGRNGIGRELTWLAYFEWANTLLAQAKMHEGIAYLERSIQSIEQVRGTFATTMMRTMFHVDKAVVFHTLAGVHVGAGRLEDAFVVQERIRARLLSEQLAGRLEKDVSRLVTVSEMAVREKGVQLQAILSDLHQLQEEANRQMVHQARVNADLSQKIDQTERVVNTLVHQIEQIKPRFSPLATQYVTTVDDVKTFLPADGCLLYYHLIDTTIHVLVINRDGIVADVPLAPLDVIERGQMRLDVSLNRALDSANNVHPELHKQIFPTLHKHTVNQLHSLYEQLLAPLERYIDGMNQLIISPIGRLFYVPFHTLFNRDLGQYALERWQISYTPSATISYLCQQKQQVGEGVFVGGYDGGNLQNVDEELAVVQSFFPTAVVENNADVQSILYHLEDKRIIHLASHARFRADNPMLSHFQLADRPLTLAEINQLTLNSELVTLSGCETGVSGLRGTDVLSLASGFMAAGTQSLLVSLWRAHDGATVQLMKTFYHQLCLGKSRVEALRSAQLQLLHDEAIHAENYVFQHPAWWGSFTLLGNWHPLDKIGKVSRETSNPQICDLG